MPLFSSKKHTTTHNEPGLGRPVAPVVGDNAGNIGHHHQGPTRVDEPVNRGGNFMGHGQGHDQQQYQTSSANDPYGAAGVGHHNNVPPTGTLNDSHQSRGGSGQRLTGKVESAIGSIVGSNALKAKGLQKEQEANAIKLQGSELAEAERLEREAIMRRERAVGHGAHPENRILGAGMTGPGGTSGVGNVRGSNPYN